jgi:NADPH:quinone reductase
MKKMKNIFKYYQHSSQNNHKDNNATYTWQTKNLPCLEDIPLGYALVQIKAFGINRADILQKTGKYPNIAEYTDAFIDYSSILGLEISAEICLMHEEDRQNLQSNPYNIELNTRIMAVVNGGAYASYIVLPLHQCMPIPKHLSYIQAAALPEAVATVWHALFNITGLKNNIQNNIHDNIWVYINAASSGIGTVAIQMCLAFGFNVVASTSSMQKLEELKSMMSVKTSAQLHIFCTQEQSLQQICDMYELKINYCLDMLGNLNELLPCMNRYAHIVSIAFLQGAKSSINIAQVMQKQITYTGTMLRLQNQLSKINLVHNLMEYVIPKIQSKHIKPIIHQVYTAEHIEQAHTDLLLNAHIGKLVVDIY